MHVAGWIPPTPLPPSSHPTDLVDQLCRFDLLDSPNDMHMTTMLSGPREQHFVHEVWHAAWCNTRGEHSRTTVCAQERLLSASVFVVLRQHVLHASHLHCRACEHSAVCRHQTEEGTLEEGMRTWSCRRDSCWQVGTGTKSPRAPRNCPTCMVSPTCRYNTDTSDCIITLTASSDLP